LSEANARNSEYKTQGARDSFQHESSLRLE
jgi:hypothetical protein